MDCKEGDYIEWCSGGLVHEHECGEHLAKCKADEPGLNECLCMRCGFPRHKGHVIEVVPIGTLEGDPDQTAVSVEVDGEPNMIINAEYIQLVKPAKKEAATK